MCLEHRLLEGGDDRRIRSCIRSRGDPGTDALLHRVERHTRLAEVREAAGGAGGHEGLDRVGRISSAVADGVNACGERQGRPLDRGGIPAVGLDRRRDDDLALSAACRHDDALAGEIAPAGDPCRGVHAHPGVVELRGEGRVLLRGAQHGWPKAVAGGDHLQCDACVRVGVDDGDGWGVGELEVPAGERRECRRRRGEGHEGDVETVLRHDPGVDRILDGAHFLVVADSDPDVGRGECRSRRGERRRKGCRRGGGEGPRESLHLCPPDVSGPVGRISKVRDN